VSLLYSGSSIFFPFEELLAALPLRPTMTLAVSLPSSSSLSFDFPVVFFAGSSVGGAVVAWKWSWRGLGGCHESAMVTPIIINLWAGGFARLYSRRQTWASKKFHIADTSLSCGHQKLRCMQQMERSCLSGL
jgi:hypothetical protein